MGYSKRQRGREKKKEKEGGRERTRTTERVVVRSYFEVTHKLKSVHNLS